MSATYYLILVAALTACEGPVGPEGPQGEQGPQGGQGPQGPQGESSNSAYVDTLIDRIEDLEARIDSLIGTSPDLINPYESGSWRETTSCEGLADDQVAVLWRKIELNDFQETARVLEEQALGSAEEADLNREHGQLARAQQLEEEAQEKEVELSCLRWLEANQ